MTDTMRLALEQIAATAPSENGWTSDAHKKVCGIATAALTSPSSTPAVDQVEAVALALINEERRYMGLVLVTSLAALEPHQYRDHVRLARAAIAAMPLHPDTGTMEALERVMPFAEHDSGCRTNDYPDLNKDCTCGYTAAMNAIRQALASAPVGGVDGSGLAPTCLKCGKPKSAHTEGAGGLLCADGNHTFLEDQAPRN